MARKQLARVPQVEFDRLADKTLLGADARQAVEDVMVHGISMAAAARRWTDRARMADAGRKAVSYQQVQMAVASVRRHQDVQTERHSVVALTVDLPGVLASALADLAPRLVEAEGGAQGLVTSYLETSIETASQMLEEASCKPGKNNATRA